MVVLHRDKWCQSAVQCVVCSECEERPARAESAHTLHCMELPSITATHANVAYPTRLDNVVKSLHCLFNGSLRVEPVALEDIDVVHLETFER